MSQCVRPITSSLQSYSQKINPNGLLYYLRWTSFFFRSFSCCYSFLNERIGLFITSYHFICEFTESTTSLPIIEPPTMPSGKFANTFECVCCLLRLKWIESSLYCISNLSHAVLSKIMFQHFNWIRTHDMIPNVCVLSSNWPMKPWYVKGRPTAGCYNSKVD